MAYSRQKQLNLFEKELSPREKQILESLCIGKRIKQICFEMDGDDTKNRKKSFYHYVNKIKLKLGAKTTEHAAAIYADKNPTIIKQLLERVK